MGKMKNDKYGGHSPLHVFRKERVFRWFEHQSLSIGNLVLGQLAVGQVAVRTTGGRLST